MTVMFLFIVMFLLVESVMYKLDEISQILSRIGDPDLIEDFLKSILTKKEAVDISSRWELVKLLDKGVSQRNIAKVLHLSLCKITRGSRELKKDNSAFKMVLKEYYHIKDKR